MNGTERQMRARGLNCADPYADGHRIGRMYGSSWAANPKRVKRLPDFRNYNFRVYADRVKRARMTPRERRACRAWLLGAARGSRSR
jgi:hypothetical protein